jgi:hypothetical protein
MSKQIVPVKEIALSIRWIRGKRLLLDFGLATLYGVTAGNLNKAAKRNRGTVSR